LLNEAQLVHVNFREHIIRYPGRRKKVEQIPALKLCSVILNKAKTIQTCLELWAEVLLKV
jgi:hypothetical protein